MWTQKFGGEGGKPFEFVKQSCQLVRVSGRCCDRVDALQFTFLDVNNGNQFSTQIYGGKGGKPFAWTLPYGKKLSAIYVTSGPRVFSIQFQTNCGSMSNVFGGDGGKFKKQGNYSNKIDCRQKRVAGVHGRSGGQIDQIGFYLI